MAKNQKVTQDQTEEQVLAQQLSEAQAPSMDAVTNQLTDVVYDIKELAYKRQFDETDGPNGAFSFPPAPQMESIGAYFRLTSQPILVGRVGDARVQFTATHATFEPELTPSSRALLKAGKYRLDEALVLEKDDVLTVDNVDIVITDEQLKGASKLILGGFATYLS